MYFFKEFEKTVSVLTKKSLFYNETRLMIVPLTCPTWMTESLWTKPSSSSSSESSQADRVMVGKSEEEPDWKYQQISPSRSPHVSPHLFKPLLSLLKFIPEGLWGGRPNKSLSVRNLDIQSCGGLIPPPAPGF